MSAVRNPAFTLTYLDPGLNFSFTKNPVIMCIYNVRRCISIHSIVLCLREEYVSGNYRLATKVGMVFINSININRTDKLVTFSDIQQCLICTDWLK